MAVFIHIGFRGFRFQRDHIQHIGHPHPFIKVPLTAPQLGNVRKWYKTETQDAVEHLEKYNADSDVYALYKDEFSQIWVCVFGGGLSKLSG